MNSDTPSNMISSQAQKTFWVDMGMVLVLIVITIMGMFLLSKPPLNTNLEDSVATDLN